MATEKRGPEPGKRPAKPVPRGAAPAESGVVVTRLIDAPRERVFRAWIEPERLKRWWAPKGWSTPYGTVEPRPGGLFHYCMLSPDGREFWGRGIYSEIVEPERIAYVDSFADEQGTLVTPSHYGLSSEHPAEALVTVTFTEQDGRTQVTLHHAIPDSVPEWAAIEQGWSEMLERLANDAAALAAAAPEAAAPMTTELRMEHRWLQRLIGDWTFEGEAIMDPQKPGEKFSGTESVRAIGDLWVMAEGKSEMPGGGAASMVMTLGYDPDKGRFVGTFIASMMTYLWRYDGALDTATNTLTLDSEGPNMAVPGTMAKFQDSIEIKDDDHRVMRSQMLGDDGQWRQVMVSNYRRKR